MQRTFMTGLAVVLLVTPFVCGDVVYHIVDYPADQDGHTLAGTITTDGTIGTLTHANIVDWEWTVSGPMNYSLSASQSITWFCSDLQATATELLVADGQYLQLSQNGGGTAMVHWEHGGPVGDNYISRLSATESAWWSTSPAMGGTDPWVIARVVPTTGACCAPDTTCTMETEVDCVAAGGTYQGDGTDCGSVDCYPPSGACCAGDGTCTITYEPVCISEGGTFMGDATLCDPNPCAPIPDGLIVGHNPQAGGSNCQIVGQSVTTPAGGPWTNISFNFYDVSTDHPSAGGTLYLLSQEYLGTPQALPSAPGLIASTSVVAAEDGGSEWMFDPAVELQPITTYWFYVDANLGVCWRADGNGSYTQGAMYHTSFPTQPFALFEPFGNPADMEFELETAPPTGACCAGDGSCDVLVEADCIAGGGTYHGDGTTCDPNPCMATIIIEKQTIPTGWPGEFTISITGQAGFSQDVTLTDGEQIVLQVPPDAYSFDEQPPYGWSPSNSFTCPPGGNCGAYATCHEVTPDGLCFRLGSLAYVVGLAAGETYSIVFTNEMLLEFGDAPDSYGTLLASDGARHLWTFPVRLGERSDWEADGLPTPAADGDDTNATDDDEDGVTFSNPLVATTTVDIDVNGGDTGGKLDAWIDFNANGVFDHPAEQVATSLDILGGVNTVAITIPAGAVAGSTYARFRISTVGGLSPTGFAEDGEVEDYQVTIEAAPTGACYQPTGCDVMSEADCAAISGVFMGPGTVCDIVDCNGNTIPDAYDIAIGTSQDCNGNDVPDECDIADGVSEDCDSNGVPDECQVDGDLDGDGDVDTTDYQMFREAFGGPVDGSPSYDACCDYDGTGIVGMGDYKTFMEYYRAYTGSPKATKPRSPVQLFPRLEKPRELVCEESRDRK